MNIKHKIYTLIGISTFAIASIQCTETKSNTATEEALNELFAPTSEQAQSSEKQKEIAAAIQKALLEGHYSPQTIDDEFSKKVFAKFLEQTDYGKAYLLKSDIEEFEQYKLKLDDMFKINDLSFYNLVLSRIQQRILESQLYYKEAIAQAQAFSGKENIQLDGKKLEWCKNEKAAKQRWNDIVKYRVLAKYVELEETQNNKKDTVKDWKIMSPEVMEDSARKVVKKSLDVNFKRLLKNGGDEYFASYENAICTVFDPHTDYFPPARKKDFDVQMSGTFFGIGAVLRDNDGICTIQEIKTGTPCWLQGSLKVDDKVLKVGQGSEEPVDIVGWEINDVVKIIRGKKGTEVRLYVKHANGNEEIIPIVRDEIHLEDVFAKSAVIQDGGKKVGYIYLPEFYADFENPNGKRCAVDMRKEIMKLKDEKVDAMIVDLRYNGGGSLSDVVDITGLFVGNGPVVQVKSKDAQAESLNARDVQALYDGPLVVMINNYSASASEILAAALQDYKRAIIVGNNTYGKGTVQRTFDLAKIAGSNATDMGSIKLTLQKFYRVNGGSTQQRGVQPDIVLPDLLMYTDNGERSEPSSLPYDEIAAPKYKTSNRVDVTSVQAASKLRVGKNSFYNVIEQRAKDIKAQNDDNVYSLNATTYKKQIQKVKDFNKQIEALDKDKVLMDIFNARADMDKVLTDEASKKKNEDWLKALKKDANLRETVNIALDLIKGY